MPILMFSFVNMYSLYFIALSILRSGYCSGNLLTNMDEVAVDALNQDVVALMDIARISPERSEYHSMEQNTIDNLNAEAFTCSEALTFMSVLRLKDIENAASLIDKTITLDWNGLDTRTANFSIRAYLRFRELYGKHCLLTDSEELEFFKYFPCNSNLVVSYKPSTGFGETTLDKLQKLGFIAQDQMCIVLLTRVATISLSYC